MVNLTESIYTAMVSGSAGCHEGTPLQDEDFLNLPIPGTPAVAILKVTLVWTDPPASMLQNSLELIVEIGAQRRSGKTSLNRRNDAE